MRDVCAFFLPGQEVAAANRTHSKDIKIVRGESASEDLHRIAEIRSKRKAKKFSAPNRRKCLPFAVMHESAAPRSELSEYRATGVLNTSAPHPRLFERQIAEETIVDQTEDRVFSADRDASVTMAMK